MKVLALGLLLVMACRSETMPLVGRVYVLHSVAGQTLPAPWAPNPELNRLAIADTLTLYGGGIGTRRFVREGDSPGTRISDDASFSWTQSGPQVTITFDCPPNALCIAGPHFVGTIGANGDLTITQSLVTRQPLAYRYLHPPD